MITQQNLLSPAGSSRDLLQKDLLSPTTLKHKGLYHNDNKDDHIELLNEAPLHTPTNLTTEDIFSNRNKSKSKTPIQSHTLQAQSLNSKLEQVLYNSSSKGFGTKRLNSLFSLLLILVSGFLLIFPIKNSVNLDSIRDNTIIESDSAMRLLQLSEIHKLLTYVFLYDHQLFTSDRYVWAGLPDCRIIYQLRLGITGPSLNDLNSDIRKSLYKLNRSFQSRLFQKIPVNYQNTTSELLTTMESNSFEVVTQIIAALDQLAVLPFTGLSITNPYFMFAFNNSDNDILVSVEDTIHIVYVDTQKKFEELTIVLIVFCSLFGLAGLALFAKFYCFQRKTMNGRDRFLNIFIRLGQQKIQEHLAIITKFLVTIKPNIKGNYQIFDPEINQENIVYQSKSAKLAQTTRKRLAVYKGINKRFVYLTVWAGLTILAAILGCFVLIPVLSTQNKIPTDIIQTLIDFDMYSYQINMLYITAVEYITFNGTSTRFGLPIEQEWEIINAKVLEKHAMIEQLYSEGTLLKKSPDLLNLLVGNLCQQIPVDIYIEGLCPLLLHGSVERGFIQLSNEVISLYRQAKQDFDASPRRFEDGFNVLNTFEMRQIDPTGSLFIGPVNIAIDLHIRTQMIQNLNCKILQDYLELKAENL